MSELVPNGVFGLSVRRGTTPLDVRTYKSSLPKILTDRLYKIEEGEETLNFNIFNQSINKRFIWFLFVHMRIFKLCTNFSRHTQF